MIEDRAGSKLLLGFVALHVICCVVPLLIAGGVISGAGALQGSPLLLGAGALVLLVGAAVGIRRIRAGRKACCPPDRAPGEFSHAATPAREL